MGGRLQDVANGILLLVGSLGTSIFDGSPGLNWILLFKYLGIGGIFRNQRILEIIYLQYSLFIFYVCRIFWHYNINYLFTADDDVGTSNIYPDFQ